MAEFFPWFSVLANGRFRCFFRRPSMNGLWRSLVARYTGGVEAVGSNPASPTISENFKSQVSTFKKDLGCLVLEIEC
jgi:hypothetical protein